MKALIVFALVILLLGGILTGCLGQESDHINNASVATMKAFSTPTPRPTAAVTELFQAVSETCIHSMNSAMEEMEINNEIYESVCVNNLVEFVIQDGLWPSADGDPSQAFLLSKRIVKEYGIDDKDYRSGRLLEHLMDAMQMSREEYNFK